MTIYDLIKIAFQCTHTALIAVQPISQQLSSTYIRLPSISEMKLPSFMIDSPASPVSAHTTRNLSDNCEVHFEHSHNFTELGAKS